MAIESLPGGGIVITGKEDTHFAALLTLASAIALELGSPSGMRFSSRVTTLELVRRHGLTPEGTRPHKKKQLALVVAELRRLRPGYTPNPSVQKVMDAEGIK